MRQRLILLAAVCLCISARVWGETSPQRIDRLQRSIEGASELGNFTRVHTLRLELADELGRIGQFAASARQYELVLASRPLKRERIKLFVRLGRSRSAAQDFGGAISAFQDALHDDPKDWDANLELARAYDHVELNSLAVDVYKRCMNLRPKDRQPYEEIGNVYQHMGYLNKAIASYEKALRIEPRPETYLAMADCFVRQGDMDRATALLQQAKTSLPRADYDIRLGDIYRKRNDLSKAVQAWEEALRSDPKRDDVRLKLLMAYGQLNRSSDADRLAKQLSTAYPESPLVHFMKAWMFFDRGDRQSARREALMVQTLAPTQLVRHYNDSLLRLLQK